MGTGRVHARSPARAPPMPRSMGGAEPHNGRWRCRAQAHVGHREARGMPEGAVLLRTYHSSFLSGDSLVRTIVVIISSGALPPKKGTANGVSACLFFWALAYFSEQPNLRSNFGRREM